MEAAPIQTTFDPAGEDSLRYHILHTAKLAWPVVLSQVSQTAVMLADAIFVGNTGSADALAAISFANSVFVIPLVAGIGISMGLTPLVSQALGEGRESTYIGRLLTNSILLNTAVGVVLVAVLFALVPLLPYFGQDPTVARLSAPVLSILALSLLPVMIYQALRQWMEGQGMPRPPMLVSVGTNLLNVGLNWVLVFGHWGAPVMGAVGSAIATLIARVVMLAGMAAVVFLLPKLKANHPIRWQVEMSLLRVLGKMGLPVGLQMFFEVGAFAFAAIMVGWLGAEMLSAHQVAISIASFTFMGASGLAAAGTVRVGYYYGAKSFRGLTLASNTAYVFGIGYMVAAASIILFYYKELPYLFFPGDAVAGPASLLLLYAALFQVADGAQVVGLGILRGMGDVRIPTIIAACAYWVAAVPVAYGIGFMAHLGVGGVWIGLTLGLFVAAVAMYARFKRLRRQWEFELATEKVKP